jgi:hypothetical protein
MAAMALSSSAPIPAPSTSARDVKSERLRSNTPVARSSACCGKWKDCSANCGESEESAKTQEVPFNPRSVLCSWQNRCALLDQRVELVEINRLDQVMLESGSLTLANILFHAEARERDCH